MGPGFYLCCYNCECYSSIVWEGERQLWVVIQGWLLMNPTMCHLYWNGEQWMICRVNEDAMPLKDFCALDEMNAFQLQIVMNDVMCLTCSLFCFPFFFVGYCFGEWAFFVGRASSSSLSFSFSSSSSSSGSFMAMWLLVLFLLFNHSLGPFFCPPLRYFFPMITLLSCLVLMLKSSHTSFMVPLLKNFLFNFSHTTAARMCVGPFFSSCHIQAASCLGNMVFSTFTILCSSVVSCTGMATGFKNFSGRLS